MPSAPVLHLADNLDLPLNAVTEPIGMFANRGKGKSNAAHRFVEQLYRAGLPAIVLDVKGDWYGIRSSSDGASPGLPFLIIGGDRGDATLEAESGQQWARFLVEQRIPTIIDLSHFSKTQARRWVMEFAEVLYRHNTDPLMLVVDEADVLIPQRLAADLFRLLGAMEDIAKRGRQRGLGVTVISQRVADVNKSVTDLLETLFLFAVTGVRTRKAIADWIDDHADPEEAKAVVATLSSLEPGECWVWSPGWLKLLKRVKLLRPETFDSHATPAPGQRRRAIKTVADVDLSVVKAAMAASIERAEAADPKRLQARLRQLENELASVRAAKPEPVVERVEVPVLSEELLVRLEALLAPVAGVLGEVQERLTWSVNQRGNLMEFERRTKAAPAPRVTQPREIAAKQRQRPAPDVAAAGADLALGKGERKVLSVLAQYPEGRTHNQLAFLAGYSAKASTLGVILSNLRRAGLVEPQAPPRLTAEGRRAVDPVQLPTGPELLDYWLAHERIGEGERRVLNALVAQWPDDMSHEELCESTGYSPTASTIGVILSKLRKLGLVQSGARRLDPDFAEAIHL